MVESRAWGRRPPILPDRQAGSLSHSRPAVPFRARWQAVASVKLRRFKHWPRGGSLFDTSVKTVLAASFSAALLTLLLTFARVLGRRYTRQSIYTYPRASRSRHRRKVFTEIWCSKSRCVAFNPLQFSASTCIAQNAWMAIECFVLLGERNRCGAFHAATRTKGCIITCRSAVGSCLISRSNVGQNSALKMTIALQFDGCSSSIAKASNRCAIVRYEIRSASSNVYSVASQGYLF